MIKILVLGLFSAILAETAHSSECRRVAVPNELLAVEPSRIICGYERADESAGQRANRYVLNILTLGGGENLREYSSTISIEASPTISCAKLKYFADFGNQAFANYRRCQNTQDVAIQLHRRMLIYPSGYTDLESPKSE